MTTIIPDHAQVLVVGGGPAGSYAAAVLAREGIDVVLLDLSKFPRYHIGESLLPSVRHYLRFIDAEDKVASHGFARKPGSAIKFNQYMREGYTDFVALGSYNSSWNVVRSEFDQILLSHAESSGAKVFTETRVDTLQFSDQRTPKPTRHPSSAYAFWTAGSVASEGAGSQHCSDSGSSEGTGVDFGGLGRPTKASYTTTAGVKGSISFDYLVDASGRNGLVSTRYLKNRKYNQSLKNVAVWGYWRGTGMYGKGTTRENAPYFEALSDESGWAWFIPLHNGLTSVGIVMEQKQLGVRSRAASSATTSPLPSSPDSSSYLNGRTQATLADKYLTFLHLAPGVQALVGDATLESVEDENGEAPSARSASDFSYSADEYAGDGWRIIGDAGAFIDPFFSSGVHLAMTGGISAAASIAASIRGDCTEAEAAVWHSKRISVSYTRFLVVVLSAYKQIRAQSENVLADIDEDNFDKAFDFFRPVIQGNAEMGARLSEDEIQKALDFCVHLFSPTTPEQHESVRRKLEEQWSPCEVDELGEAGVEENRSHTVPTASESCHPTLRIVPEAPPAEPQRSLAERLLDVRAPIVDPSALSRLVRSKLSLFRRSSSTSVCTVASNASRSSTTMSTGSSSCPSSPIATSFWSSASESRTGDMGDEGGDEEMRMVLEKVNARRVIHAEHGEGLNSLEEEPFGGLVARLVRGRLGLDVASERP